MDTISKSDLVKFFAWLQQDSESKPDGVAPRRKFKLSQKSIDTSHISGFSRERFAAVMTGRLQGGDYCIWRRLVQLSSEVWCYVTGDSCKLVLLER